MPYWKNFGSMGLLAGFRGGILFVAVWVFILSDLTTNFRPGSLLRAAELKLDARTLYDQSVSDHVTLSADGTAVVLEEGVLFEDDGPAAGYSYKPNQETLMKNVSIKKELIIPNPKSKKAYLLVGINGKNYSAQAVVNGKSQNLEGGRKTGDYSAGLNWDAYAFDPNALQPGKNEIVLSGSGILWIARDDDFAAGSRTRTRHPNRSAKSTDGGKTWDYDHLGKDGQIDGEYYLRVFLDQYQPQGSLLLAVMDAGNLEGKPIAEPLVAVGPVRIAAETEASQEGRITLRARSGTTYVPDEKNWSSWQDLKGNEGSLENLTGRYLQIAVDLTAGDPLETPKLKQITVSASPRKTGQWTENLNVLETHNEQIIRTSIPFEYEPSDHPALKTLRRQYSLDEVVKGARSEFELITRLAAWSSQQWTKGHLGSGYPDFNALEILQIGDDGTPVGGFCQHYNLVFLQACESFGLSGRSVSISPGNMGADMDRKGGHEVTEIWSNQFKKWIYVDGNTALYTLDEETQIPMSLLEIRERKIAALNNKPFKPVKFVKFAETKYDWTNLQGKPPILELRIIPRSNYLQEKSPLPLNQGMKGWFWTGHYVWTDELLPASLLYGNRISKRQNFEWTLNQAHYVLEATQTPGELRVHLDTETPGFETFLADIDGTGKKPIVSGFTWKLHPGNNRLEVSPRNLAGKEGIASWVVLEYR